MRLGRIKVASPDGDQGRIVAVVPEEGRVVDLARAYAVTLQRRGAGSEGAIRVARALFPASMARAIGAGDAFLDAAQDALKAADDASVSIDTVSWLPAVDSPMLRDSVTYPHHMKDFFKKRGGGGLPVEQIFKTPPYFKGSTGAMVAHNEVLPYPSYTEYLDWEFEVGIIVGGAGRNLDPQQAEELIFGYTIFNDWSARDVQPREMAMGMGPQKSKDFAYGIGPVVVTKDEIPVVGDLKGQVRINGEVVSNVSAAGPVFSPAELVAWVSVHDNLQPGDLIGTGTMGNGSGLEIDRKLEVGDILELELDTIGVLRTPIGEPEIAPWWVEEKPYPWAAEAAEAGAR